MNNGNVWTKANVFIAYLKISKKGQGNMPTSSTYLLFPTKLTFAYLRMTSPTWVG